MIIYKKIDWGLTTEKESGDDKTNSRKWLLEDIDWEI